MNYKTNGPLQATTPRAWTFEPFFEKETHAPPYAKWVWAHFADLRACVDAVRGYTGRFPLPAHLHHPALLTAFGYLMSPAVNQSGSRVYTFAEKDGARVHVDVDYFHDNLDDLFVPMGWAKIVLELVSKGINEIRHQYKEGPHLYALYEGTKIKEEIIKTSSRMGWKLSGHSTAL